VRPIETAPSAGAAELTLDRTAFGRSALRQGLVLLVTFKIVGILLLVDPNGIQAVDLPKSMFSNALGALIVGLLALSVLRFGTNVLPRTRLHLVVLLFLAANVVSAAFAESHFIAVYGESERYLGLTFLLDMAILYVAVAVAFRQMDDFILFFGALGVAILLVAIYAAAQDLGLDPINWVRYEGDRPFSTFGLADQLGHFLSLCVGLGLAVAAFSQGRHRWLARWIGIALALLSVSAAAVVATRGSLLGIGAALVAALVIRFRVDRVESQRGFRGILSLTLVGVALLLVIVFSPLGARAARAVDDEGSGRLEVYRVALLASLDRPLLGFGPDNLGTVYQRYRDVAYNGPGSNQTSAHNWILQSLVTTGVVGLAAHLLLVVSFGVALWSRALPKMPLVAAGLALPSAAYWTNGLVSVGSVSVDWFPWFVFGAIAAIVGRRPSEAAPRSVQPALATAVVVSALVLAALPYDAVMANRSAQLARAALAAGPPASVVDPADAAVRYDPGRADYWNWLGIGLERAGRPEDATAAYAEAARRAPYEATYWENLALVTAREAIALHDEARASGALDAARRATQIEPKGWHAQQILADVAFQLDRYDVALEAAVTALQREGRTSKYDQVAADAARRLPSPNTLALLEEALATKETAALHVAVADVALRSGEKQVALTHVRRALILEPENAEAKRILASLG
jgi:O-antigen ligase/Flp pilus assembly protein TadD